MIAGIGENIRLIFTCNPVVADMVHNHVGFLLHSLSALTDEPDEPSCASSLSHGWYTMLESAYEHLHDRQGLCNLYMYYILTTHDERDCIYVRQLRDIAQDQWSTYCATMVKLMQKRRPIGSRTLLPYPAYERLLREEHLSDAAVQF
ncbi:MAG: hypothetical protein V8Q46_06125 [Bifidobacterium angulatum]